MDIDPDNINIEEGYSRKRKFEPEYSELDEINARNKALDSKLEDLRVDNSIRQVPDYIHQGLIYPSMAYGKGSYGRKRGYRRTGGKRMPSASSIARAIGRAQVSAAERAAFWGASGMSVPGVQGSARMNMFGSNWANANPAQRYARRAMRFRGEGGFWDSLKSGLKSVASVAGPIARLIPHPAAQAVGQGLALTGLGAYEHVLWQLMRLLMMARGLVVEFHNNRLASIRLRIMVIFIYHILSLFRIYMLLLLQGRLHLLFRLLSFLLILVWLGHFHF